MNHFLDGFAWSYTITCVVILLVLAVRSKRKAVRRE